MSGVDEDGLDGGSPAATAAALDRLKAEAVAARLGEDRLHIGRELVLGCDSVFELDGVAQGKPRDAADAVARWQAMRGRTGVLHTGHHVVDLGSDRCTSGLASAQVTFGEVSDDEVTAYVAPLVFGGESAPTLAAVSGQARSVAISLILVDAEAWDDGGVLLHYKLS